MLAWLRRLLAPAPAASPRLRDLMERVDELEGDQQGLRTRIKKLEGRVSAMMREDVAETAEDAPERTNGGDPGPRPTSSTAHLASRFRGF